MATSPHDPEIVYYGSQYLHRTRDKGVTWEKISTDLTANDPCCQGASGEPITRDVTGEEFYSTLLRNHRVAARARRDLDGFERRAVQCDARQRQDVDERHAEGSAARRPRRLD
jgi:hypothetical protein